MLTAEFLRQVWKPFAWLVGPWVCGILLVLALTAFRVLMNTSENDGRYDVTVHGRYIVVARVHAAHAVSVLVLALVLAGCLAFILSKQVART